jgi:hypothetical protein
MQEMQTHCPICNRYCGPVKQCPYCDATIPFPRLYRQIRASAWILATVGLIILILAAARRPPETIPIRDITPAMQFSRLFFEGELTRAPRISRNQNSASTDLDDGSGRTLRIVFLEDAVVSLKEIQPPLTAGSRIRVQGGLRVQADEPPVMFIRSPDQFQILQQP